MITSTPGKLILMGEHAVVYGCPALVVAIDPRTRVELREGGESGVELDLVDLRIREKCSWAEILAYAHRVRVSWQRFAEDPSEEAFGQQANAPTRVVKVALGESLMELGLEDLPGLHLRVESDLPLGSGYGSSASVSVGVAAALFGHLEGTWDEERIARVALETERRQHGWPSGVDHQTVLRGGGIWFRSIEGEGLEIEPLQIPPDVAGRFKVYQTGTPRETTGMVVAAVRRRRDSDRRGFERLLSEMEEAVIALKGEVVDPAPDPVRLAEEIKSYEGCLERLGVVPETVVDVIRQLESMGAVAKLSGAGALSGVAAGSLLTFWPGDFPQEGLEAIPFQELPVALGAAGVMAEMA